MSQITRSRFGSGFGGKTRPLCEELAWQGGGTSHHPTKPRRAVTRPSTRPVTHLCQSQGFGSVDPPPEPILHLCHSRRPRSAAVKPDISSGKLDQS